MTENFKVITYREGTDKTHLFFQDEKSLYRKWGNVKAKNGENVTYYKCIENDCPCRGKLVNSRFTRTRRHNHEIPEHSNHTDNHEHQTLVEIAYQELKEEVIGSTRSVRDIHREKIAT